MRKTILFPIIALGLCTAAAFAAEKAPAGKPEPAKAEMKAPMKHDCSDCPMHKKQGAKKCGGMTCPEKIAGAETASRNIETGVEITVTAKAAETVAKIQELAMVHYGPKAEKCHGCPTTVPGAETKVENLQDGIKVTITGKTPDTVKKIQAASAAEHKGTASGPKQAGKKESRAAKKYTCAMKCVVSDKPGKCPKCGMPMQEIK